MTSPDTPLADLPVALERDGFTRLLIRELTGTLQDVVGTEEAAGFVSIVGQRIGERIDQQYRAALQVPKLDRDQVARVLVDLKARIQGDFRIVEEDDRKIVLANRACPFGELVKGRPSLCMMTSNVFGVIAAENLGYARVTIEKAIARGDSECHVVVYLGPPPESDEEVEGQEYFRT
jgi:predicted ArsR family transcriptional regulator